MGRDRRRACVAGRVAAQGTPAVVGQAAGRSPGAVIGVDAACARASAMLAHGRAAAPRTDVRGRWPRGGEGAAAWGRAGVDARWRHVLVAVPFHPATRRCAVDLKQTGGLIQRMDAFAQQIHDARCRVSARTPMVSRRVRSISFCGTSLIRGGRRLPRRSGDTRTVALPQGPGPFACPQVMQADAGAGSDSAGSRVCLRRCPFRGGR